MAATLISSGRQDIVLTKYSDGTARIVGKARGSQAAASGNVGLYLNLNATDVAGWQTELASGGVAGAPTGDANVPSFGYEPTVNNPGSKPI